MRRVTQTRTIGIALGLCFGLGACGAIEGLGSPPFVSDEGPDGAPDALSMPDVLGPDGGPDVAADVASDVTIDVAADVAPDVTPEAGVLDATPEAGVLDATPEADVLEAATDADEGGSHCTWTFSGTGTLMTSINAGYVQNIPAAVTPNGSTILIQRGPTQNVCTIDHLLLVADETSAGSGVYATLQVTPPAGMDTAYEENVTMTGDGLTLIALNAEDTGFLMSTRTATGMVDFGAATAGPFSQIAATGSQTLWAPVISFDGLAFYYVVQNDPTAAVNGIYESVRGSNSVPFPPGTLMPPTVQSLAQYVTGLTADRLAIFLEDKTVFDTNVLTRASVLDPFTNPSPSSPPPTLPGLRMHAIDGCSRLIGSGGSGCVNEEIFSWAQ
jgi:hypothetical protein